MGAGLERCLAGTGCSVRSLSCSDSSADDREAVIEMQQALIGIVTLVISLIIPFLLYLRSRKVDKVAEQAGVSASSQAGTAQIIEGLNAMLENQQEETNLWRADFKDLRTYTTQRLDLMVQRLDAKDQEIGNLKHQLALMIRRFGTINGVDNGNGIPNSGPIT